jgi:2,4-dienoyl-CoA reductase-like NADH-dependent reductase (Old Yellow Enzyme family)
MPLLVRISATEWMEHDASQPSWDLAQSKQLAVLLADAGVDLLDVSSGGNNPAQQIKVHAHYPTDLAAEIRAELARQGRKGMAIGAVGMVSTAELARDAVQAEGTVQVDGGDGTTAKADLVLVARQFLREPEFVLTTAARLGVKVQPPIQYHRAPYKKERL